MFKISTRQSKPLPIPLFPNYVRRWSVKKKLAILHNLEGRNREFIQEVLDHYHISLQEFVLWQRAFYHKGGSLSLRASKRPIIKDDEIRTLQE